MSETRAFPTAVIASITTGILLCKFSDMHEAAEYLMGHPIWTHHFADKKLKKSMCDKVLEQCPSMPVTLNGVNEENYLDKAKEIEMIVGKTVSILKGDGTTAISPFLGIPGEL